MSTPGVETFERRPLIVPPFDCDCAAAAAAINALLSSDAGSRRRFGGGEGGGNGCVDKSARPFYS